MGRFFNTDPLSEEYGYQSHYNFSENRVTNARELEGLEAQNVNEVSLPADPWEFGEMIAGSINSVRAAVSNNVVRTYNTLSGDAIRNKYEVDTDGSLTLVTGVPKESFKEKVVNGAFDLGTIGLAAAGGPEGVLMGQGGKAATLKGVEEIKKAVKVAQKEENVVAKRSSFRRGTLKNAWDGAQNGSKANTKLCPTCKKDVEGNPYLKEKRNGPNGWDGSHNPSWSKRNLKGKTRKEQLDNYNKGVELECKSCNRSAGNNDERFKNR